MKNYKVLTAFLFLLGISIYSAIGFINATRQKYALLRANNEIKEELRVLEAEKQNLLNEKQNLAQELEKQIELQQRVSHENSLLKEYLQASTKRIDKLFEDFQELQKENEQLDSQYTLLKAENAALRQESESLKIKLSSVTELKEAIKELKGQMRKVGLKIRKTAHTLENGEGNCGFLIKDGKSTYSTKIKIKVIPVSGK